VKPCYRVGVFGLCLAFGVALPVRGMQLAGVAEQPGLKSTSGPQDVPPLPLEFYGYSYGRDATPQLAFLRQGDRIIIAAEGDLIEDTYRLVRIAADSAVVEDTFKTHRQTLPLTAPKPHNDSGGVQPTASVARTVLSRNPSPASKNSRPVK
jgi:hypothetical protein